MFKMPEKTFVTILAFGARFQFGLTKKTTSSDVIKMAKMRNLLPNDNKQYGLYEKSFGTEKLLPVNTKVLKQVRTWGVNRRDFELELKPVDKLKSKITRAKAKLGRLRTILRKNELKDEERFDKYLENNLASNVCKNDDKHYEKNITLLHELPTLSPETVRPLMAGKVELMTRYLKDSESFDFCSDISRISESERTRGDGCDAPDPSIITGMDKTGSHTIIGDLDMGFICNTSLFEYQSDTRDELNDCVLYDDFNSTLTDDESAFEDDSECGSVCELERNVLEENADDTLVKINTIKAAFSNCDVNAKLSEDSMLESFMNTFVRNEESDEGLSSVGSDFE